MSSKVQKILPLVQQTAEILSIDEPLVAKIISHQFKEIRSTLLDPQPNESIVRIEQLGKFRAKLAAINKELSTLIALLRENRTDPTLLKRFRYFWTIRQDIIRDDSLRDYKKRYGKWHN